MTDQEDVLLRIWRSRYVQHLWNRGPIQRAWNSIAFNSIVGIVSAMAAFIVSALMVATVEPLSWQTLQSYDWTNPTRWVAVGLGLGIFGVFGAATSRVFFLFIAQGVIPVFLGFVLNVTWCTSLLLYWKQTQELAGLSLSQLVVLVIASAISQLIFAAHAWRLRKLPLRVLLSGVHSGIVFAVLNAFGFHLLLLLVYLDPSLRSAINGEFWAVLGVAQLIVALTSGWSESRAALTEWELRQLLAQRGDS